MKEAGHFCTRLDFELVSGDFITLLLRPL